MAEVIRVKGLAELQRTFREMDRELLREIRRELAEAGKIISDDERSYLSGIGASRKSIGGIRPQVRVNTVSVQQRYGTVTGRRGDWGVRIMSSLVRARAARRPEVVERLDEMLDRLAVRHGF